MTNEYQGEVAPMRKTTNALRLLAAWVLALALALVCAPAKAEADTLDLTQTGTLTVTVTGSEEGGAAAGGTVAIYKVADASSVDSQIVYTLTDDFAASGVSLDDLSDSTIAASLAAYLEGASVEAYETATLDANGSATFESLTAGLYLVVQPERATGYLAFDAFVVQVPMTIDGVWSFDVTASPKADEYDEPVVEVEETPTPAVSTTTLPTTGDETSMMPIVVLAIAGVALVAAGYVISRRSRGED